MDEMISIGDLGFLVMFLLAIGVGVLLIIVLYNINKFIKRINSIVEDNKSNIDKSIAIIPEAANNLNQAALSIKDTSDKAGEIIENLGGTVTQAAASAEDTAENVIDIIRSVINVAKTVITMINRD